MRKELLGRHVSAMANNYSPEEFKKLSGNYPDLRLMTTHFFPDLADKKILGIYAGYMGGPDGHNIINCDINVLINYIKDNYTPDSLLLFDNLYEGGVDIVVSRIHKIIDTLGLDPLKVYYSSAALDAKMLYDKFCKRDNSTYKINILSANSWELALLKASEKVHSNFRVENRKKLFLCFNRVLRAHRLALVALMLSEHLVDKSYYSFFPDYSHSGNTHGDGEKAAFYSLKQFLNNELYTHIESVYNQNKSIFPLRLNISPEYNKNFLSQDDAELFENSYISLVTETFFFKFNRDWDGIIHDDHSIFFSEKIYKPILMKHPFILVGRPYSLVYLRKLGYRTFSPFINESYDRILDDSERLNAIIAELVRLSKFSDDEWITFLSNIKDIVEHNHNVLKNRPQHGYVIK